VYREWFTALAGAVVVGVPIRTHLYRGIPVIPVREDLDGESESLAVSDENVVDGSDNLDHGGDAGGGDGEPARARHRS